MIQPGRYVNTIVSLIWPDIRDQPPQRGRKPVVKATVWALLRRGLLRWPTEIDRLKPRDLMPDLTCPRCGERQRFDVIVLDEQEVIAIECGGCLRLGSPREFTASEQGDRDEH